jgi:pyruvate/2-oxoglutarate dehydrogenase complex dihydrolipoamide dehydrogenase (E3) component
MTKHVIVVGGGPAGVEAARAAAGAGARVSLVSNAPVGGRAGWHSLLPSKVWLTAAETLGTLNEAWTFGLATGGARLDAVRVVERIGEVKSAWNASQSGDLVALGIAIVEGTGSLASATSVAVVDAEGGPVATLDGDAIILAPGSVPIFPPNLKPDGQRVLAPRFASGLDMLPPSVIVVGAGPTGTEFVYLFNALGLETTWIVDQYGVLPDFAPEAGAFIKDVMAGRGVRIVEGYFAERAERTEDGVTITTTDGGRHMAAAAFIAIGRRPDLASLNLDAAGLEPDARGRLPVDAYRRTSAPTVYAVGDVNGPMLANQAAAEAWIAGRHAAGADAPPFHEGAVVAAIYSEPQAAQVGVVAGDGVETVRVPFSAGLKPHLGPHGEGFLTLAYDAPTGQVRGAVAVGPHAADALAPVAMALRLGGTVADLAAYAPAYPTVGELASIAARMIAG